MTKKELEAFDAKLADAAEAAAKAAGQDNSRIGTITPENAVFIGKLIERMFYDLPRGKAAENIGALNEIFIYLNAVYAKLWLR